MKHASVHRIIRKRANVFATFWVMRDDESVELEIDGFVNRFGELVDYDYSRTDGGEITLSVDELEGVAGTLMIAAEELWDCRERDEQ